MVLLQYIGACVEANPELLAALQAVLPPESLLYMQEDLRPYECDGLTAYRRLPMMVAIPETLEQIQAILRTCHRTGTPVVARGAGTGLSGGALPHSEGLLLSLTKFNKVLAVDPAARTATVEPGVRNLAISQAAAPYGLYYAPDPSSQVACSIGGNVAENSGGIHCLKYGLTVHNILRLKLFTIEGETLEVGSAALDTQGFDLLALLTGSEGMLGIISEITVKLLPIPESAQLILAAFDDIEKAGSAVGNIIADGIIPAGLEMMDKLAIQAAEGYVHAGYPLDAEALLLCELDGVVAEVSEQMRQVEAILNLSGATQIRVARNAADRQRMWAGRKASFPAVGRLAPDYYCMDGTIPRKQLPHVLRRIQALSQEYRLPVANVFHAGDGNLHPLILYDANQPGELERVERMGSEILLLCIEVGGTITGEHGVGVEKIGQMCAQFGSGELEIFHGIKCAFDPLGLLNPGKAVPSLHRCAELGAMHVHHGDLKFPELPRF